MSIAKTLCREWKVRKTTPTSEICLSKILTQKHVICAGGPTSSGRQSVIVVIYLRLRNAYTFASKEQQCSVILYLVTEKVVFCEGHRRMKAAYEKHALSLTSVQNLAQTPPRENLLKFQRTVLEDPPHSPAMFETVFDFSQRFSMNKKFTVW